MLRAFSLTIGQLGDPVILRVLMKSLALTLLIFIILGGALAWGARAWAVAQGWGSDGGFVAAAAAFLSAIAAAWLLFRAIAIPVMNIFIDEVVEAIEARHYPQFAATAHRTTIATSLRLGMISILRLLICNLIALPFYIILLVTGIGPVILFIGLNAVLLGRDLGEMVAVRHPDRAAAKDWLRMTRGPRAVMGLIVTGILTLPFVNLLAPIVGAGIATHLFHGDDV